MCEKQAGLGAGGICVHVGGGLEMGIRQHPTCPREVIHPGLSPVWVLRMKGQEVQNGLARNRWCWAENSGPCPAGGGRASAQCKEIGLAVSVWAELAATAVPTWSPWGE